MPRPKTKAQDIRNPEHYFNRTIALEIKNDQKKLQIVKAHECSLEEKMSRPGFEAKYSVGGDYEDFIAQIQDEDPLSWIETIKKPYIYETVKALPEAYQQILTMLVVEGLSQHEIARKLGVNQNVIYKKIIKIRKKLHEGWSKK